ncbi:UNVERIFIED_CONTAM: hypothetical protein HDU68_001765 [Siphonaria sp. JEL0065]|nr:hypothetical protein HDU68_001765 [Siphonaria sp. JEL0065]
MISSTISILFATLFTQLAAAQTCGTAFVVGGANSQPDLTNTLIPNGGSWLEPFKAPLTGSLCSFAFNVYPAQAGIPVRPSSASLSLYLQNTTKDTDIVNGVAKPFARATADINIGSQSITFNFCETQAPLSSNSVITFVLTNTGLTNPIVVAFGPGTGAGYLYSPGSVAQSGFGGVKQINSSVTFRFTASEYGKALACDRGNNGNGNGETRGTTTRWGTPTTTKWYATTTATSGGRSPVSAPTVSAPRIPTSSYSVVATSVSGSHSVGPILSPMPSPVPPPSPKPNPTSNAPPAAASGIVELNAACLQGDYGCGNNNALLYCDDSLTWTFLNTCEFGCQYICPDLTVNDCPGQPVTALCYEP